LKYLKKHWLYVSTIALALITFIIVYRPTLFNFFIADDFYQMTWMNGALECPNMLLKTYWTPWIECRDRIPTTDSFLFYRPVFASILFWECKFLGLNGLYLRLVNLVIELASGLMVALIVLAFDKTSNEESSLSIRQSIVWALFSAIFFVLFPSHSESVNWIADGSDLWVTLFSLVSLWCYIQWRNKSKQSFLIFSIVSALLAFLTKEMAVALPPTILAYEFFVQRCSDRNTQKIGSDSINAGTQLHMAITTTLPYWLICILYFCLRKLLLGDFIGGYPDNMCNPLSISGWLKGLYTIFVPINPFIIGTHLLIYRSWHIVLSIIILLTIIATIKINRDKRKVIYFLIIWFLLCLAPVYKVFATSLDYPCGQRIIYLASVPICMLLTYGIAYFCAGKQFSFVSRAITLSFFGFAVAMLYANNLAFAQAGHVSNKIVQSFRAYYQNIPGDPLVYAVGLPKLSNGIYIPLGHFLNGMMNRPMLDKNRLNCSWIGSDDQYTSIGFLKQAIEEKQQQIHLLYWDSELEVLKPVMSFSQDQINKDWQDISLRQTIRTPSFPHISQPDVHWLMDGTLDIVSHKSNSKYTIIELDLKELPCWQINFLALKLQLSQPENLGSFRGAQLFFVNDIARKYSKEYFGDYFVYDCCYAAVKATKQEQEIIFPLRNLPAWTMGGRCHSIRVVLPADCNINIKKIWLPDIKDLMPSVHLQSTTDYPPDRIKLDRYQTLQHIRYDARSINGCKQIVLEIVPNSKFFTFLNSKDNSKIIFLKKSASSSWGQFSLSRSEFPAKKTIYRAQLRALDEAGNQLGFPSDQFFIYTDL